MEIFIRLLFVKVISICEAFRRAIDEVIKTYGLKSISIRLFQSIDHEILSTCSDRIFRGEEGMIVSNGIKTTFS